MTPSTLPDPLNTAEIDLRGYDYMPLFGHQLFASSFYTEASAEVFKVGLKLWWVAWLQCPAGSLPNNDTALRTLADLGRDTRTWNRIKEAAMHGFVLCSDGRWYHPYLCELARTAMNKRLKDRARKARQRAHGAEQPPLVTDDLRGTHTERCEARDDQPIENTQFQVASHAEVRGTSAGHGVGQGAAVTREGKGSEAKGREGKEKESQSSALQTSVAQLSIEQQSDQIAAVGEVAAPSAPRIEDTRHKMPRANDPPHRWIGSGLAPGVDGKPVTGLDKGGTPHLLAGKLGVNRTMLDYAARSVCDAARIDPAWRGDWWVLIGWLNEGFGLQNHIIPAITGLVERRIKTEKGYTRPATLRYFDSAIKEYAAAHREAA